MFPPQVILTLTGAISDILDLTDTALYPALGTSHEELTGAWALPQSTCLAGQGPMPTTQQLGAQAFASGRIVGLRYPAQNTPAGWASPSFRATDRLTQILGDVS